MPGDSIFQSNTDLSDSIAHDVAVSPTPLTPNTPKQLTPEEAAAFQEKKDNESNWLLQDYEESMRLNSGNGTASEENSLYLQIASDKDLAKLAGIAFHQSSDPSSVTTLHTGHTGATDPAQNGATLRDDSSSKADDKKNNSLFSQNEFLKPFLAPFNSSQGKDKSNFFSGSDSSASDANLPKMTAQPGVDKQDMDVDALTLETPGLTAAAQNDPLVTIDSSLDMLPGESVTHAQEHQDLLSGELPASSSTLQLQEAQKKSLDIPEAPKIAEPVVISPLLLTPQDLVASNPKPPGAPEPVPARPHVADPRDFLNR